MTFDPGIIARKEGEPGNEASATDSMHTFK